MKLFKTFLLSLFMLVGLITFSQSGYSTNTYYATQGQYTNTHVGYVRQWVSTPFGGYYTTCSQYRETLWKSAYGSKQVRVWNYNTGQWYWEWQEGYYWYYIWNYYTRC